MPFGQGYLNSRFTILPFSSYTSSQSDKGPTRDYSWRIVSPVYYSFNLVKQENSVVRDQAEINISLHFL